MARSHTASLTVPPHNLRSDLERIVDGALQAIAPSTVFARPEVRQLLETIDGPVVVIAAGKAAWPMAVAFERLRPGISGILAGPRVGATLLPRGFEWFNAGHPNPTPESARAGRRALELASSAGNSTVIVLLSGGASALMVDPASGVTLEDKMATAQALMRAGVAIDGLNCVRKHLSGIKGGRLGAAARRSMTFAISDVHGPVADDPSVIGSGPTVADPTTYRDALDVIELARTRAPGLPAPASILRHLDQGARGEVPETIKPGDHRLDGASYAVIANRLSALEGARAAAESLGYDVHVVSDAITGQARVAAEAFVAFCLRAAQRADRPVCVLGSGETTVLVTGSGLGGRNQEFALAAAALIAEDARETIVASIGTDGVDGPTDAAGAVVDRTTLDRGRRGGRDWHAALADNDAYHYLRPLGDLIVLGPTGTNVGDLQVFLSTGAPPPGRAGILAS